MADNKSTLKKLGSRIEAMFDELLISIQMVDEHLASLAAQVVVPDEIVKVLEQIRAIGVGSSTGENSAHALAETTSRLEALETRVVAFEPHADQLSRLNQRLELLERHTEATFGGLGEIVEVFESLQVLDERLDAEEATLVELNRRLELITRHATTPDSKTAEIADALLYPAGDETSISHLNGRDHAVSEPACAEAAPHGVIGKPSDLSTDQVKRGWTSSGEPTSINAETDRAVLNHMTSGLHTMAYVCKVGAVLMLVAGAFVALAAGDNLFKYSSFSAAAIYEISASIFVVAVLAAVMLLFYSHHLELLIDIYTGRAVTVRESLLLNASTTTADPSS